MKTRVLLFGVLCFALLFSSCCCVGGARHDWNRYKNEFEKSYAIRTPARVTVKNLDGFVHVNAWDKNEVSVTGVVSVRAENEKDALKLMKEIDVIISHEDNSLSIRVERKRHTELSELWRLGSDWKVDIELSVPRECALAVSTVDGDVRVSEIKGAHKLSTVDGSIDAQGVEGAIECRTVDGGCSIKDVSGDVSVNTTDGGIRVRGILSGLSVKSVDGGIRVEAAEGSAVSRQWVLSSVCGSITLGVPPSLSADLEASTTDGHISIAVPAELSAMTERKVSARLGRGGGTVSVSTTDGSIKVRASGAEGEESGD
ncbi:MAG: DUF4097 family beta strand repeat-containing protein [Candidatus Eisenbacteria bacterium]|nr:DUF4097 family beta strand repeat-containing protein [Candidatus Eisenbacteria bacterium]